MVKVLFVCLGNICRSPMAEAVFKHLVAQAGLSHEFEIDSVGTAAYHIGKPSHQGTQQILAAHGITCGSVARQLTPVDIRQADYLIAMDQRNLADIGDLAQGTFPNGRPHLLLEFAQGTPLREVPDPYHTDNFEEVYHLVEGGCRGLLAHIRQEKGL